MSKQQKKKQKQSNPLPNNGRNRQERRAQTRNPRTSTASKPTWLRILIVAVIAAIFIGFCLAPLIGR